MQKICFLLGNYFKYYKGGAELQAYFIAKKLINTSTVHYIFNRPPINSKINFIPKIDDGIFLYPMKQYRNRLFGKLFFLNFFELIRLLKKIDPDIIYQRGGKPYIGISSRLLKKNNKKLVIGISMNDNCYKNKILNLDHNFLSYPSKIIDGYFTLQGIEKADLIIAQTEYQQTLLKKNFNKESIIIPNGLPVPKPTFKKEEPPLISWIANIKPLKKPELFINLAEKCRDLNVKFVLVGRSSRNSYQKMLIQKTKKLSNIEYLGEISFERTNELLSKSILLVNTSVTEGFSNTYLQAWMRETPVITINCDPDSIIKSNKIGFHSGSFKKMIDDVKYLIDYVDELKNMGKKAREYAIKYHDIEKIGNEYLYVFERLIKK